MAFFEKALDLYAIELPKRIVSYQKHRSLDRLLAETLEVIGYLLASIARLIGYFDGTNEDYTIVPEVKSKLREEGLDEWAQRFALELRRLWKTFGKWTSFDDFTDINIHVERLMWRHGLFIWSQGDGGEVRVMPPNFDFNGLIKSIPEKYSRDVADPIYIKALDELRS